MAGSGGTALARAFAAAMDAETDDGASQATDDDDGRAAVLLLRHLVARRDQRVEPDRKVLLLLEAGAPALVHHLQLERLVLRLVGRRPRGESAAARAGRRA